MSDGCTLGGSGEVVFNTTGNNVSLNYLSGNTWTLGGGVLVHGKSGQLGGGFSNSGTVVADTPGETLLINDVINSGNIIAAPGTVSIDRFTQTAAGFLTTGIGGTVAGTSFGVFKFIDTGYFPALNGTFNAVTLNGYAPTANAVFNVASFTKTPTGNFTTTHLDAGNGKAFDLTQTPTAISLKAKTVAGAFAMRSSTAR